MIKDWHEFPDFRKAEFDCSHSGDNDMDPDFMQKLQHLRRYCGFPFTITSGYRDVTHPIEARKEFPGYHTEGIAADIGVWSDKAYKIIAAAPKFGFTGIGVSQKDGQPRFIHLDTREEIAVVYSY